MNKLLTENSCRFTAGPCDLAPGTTVGGAAISGGGGETNTASNLGGGLANWDSKSGVDLRFNSFAAADFDLASNLLAIDATKWLTIVAAAAAYQPLDTDLTSIAALATTAFGRGLLDDADAAAVRSTISAQASDADLDDLASDGILSGARGGVGTALPTCGGTDKLTSNGTVVSCATDQTGGGGGAGYAEIVAAGLAGF